MQQRIANSAKELGVGNFQSLALQFYVPDYLYVLRDMEKELDPKFVSI